MIYSKVNDTKRIIRKFNLNFYELYGTDIGNVGIMDAEAKGALIPDIFKIKKILEQSEKDE